MESSGTDLEYNVTIRQQPQHARISAMKISDRRPVDPPIIVQLSVTDPRDLGVSPSPPLRTPHQASSHHSHLTNPYYFMYAALIEAHSDNEVKYVCDGGSPSTSGALVSSVRVLKDYPNSDQDAAFFIFSNICVRLEGSWRFKLSLFVIDGDKVKLCATTCSAPFFVYQGKQYPGVQASTPLTQALAAQGVKLRIRRDIRQRNSIRAKEEEQPLILQEAGDNNSATSSPDLTLSRSPPKRRRTLTSPVESLHSFDSPSPTDTSDTMNTPRHQSPLYASEKMSPYEGHFRRASLDAQRSYLSREWITPRVLDEYSSLPPFNFSTSRPEPDYHQWGLMRPVHPSPENSSALLRQAPTPEIERPLYSWGTAAGSGSRDFFPQSATPPDDTHEQFSPSTAFWQMNGGGSRVGPFEHQAVAMQRPAWTGRALYRATQ
ncbi:velvet factor-domain-containing protein [Mycena albidolilacea]|uniref:Velvet factor-domain-containing protein n=1 Tax=Mycena albidolilacea TaxID=1033008 RepID=A0AAD7ABY4_9AGAR|nr:velvet factor-domain-containing protein [Mycena albidolilacea]